MQKHNKEQASEPKAKAKRQVVRRTKIQRDADRVLMMSMLQQGYSQVQVALTLGISQEQVSRDWRRLAKQLRATALGDVDEERALMRERLAFISTEAVRGWEASKQPAETITVQQLPDGGTLRRTVTETHAGDARFLDVFLDAVQAESILFGLVAVPPNVVVNNNRFVANNVHVPAPGGGGEPVSLPGEAVAETIGRIVLERLAKPALALAVPPADEDVIDASPIPTRGDSECS